MKVPVSDIIKGRENCRGDMKKEEIKNKFSSMRIFNFNKPENQAENIKCEKYTENKIIYIEPRTLRHQDRIIDLFRVLFKRR